MVLCSAAGAVVVAGRRGALGVGGTAPTAAAHLLNNVDLSPQLCNDTTTTGKSSTVSTEGGGGVHQQLADKTNCSNTP